MTAVFAAYLHRMRLEWGVVTITGLFGLFVERRFAAYWVLTGLSVQILILGVENLTSPGKRFFEVQLVS